MRIFLVLPIFSILFGASASSLDSRWLDAHPLDARNGLDLCAFVNADLVVGGGDYLLSVGTIDQCICLTQIDQFMTGLDLTAEALSLDAAVTVPETLYYDILMSAPKCNYPANGVPACVNDNPCGFTCMDGYTASPSDNPTTCVPACAAPNVMCNGNCVAGPCPSSQATVKKRWVGSGSCTEKGYGWAACGVFGRGTRAWECVNTARDLESCGGCVFPLTPFSPIGQDCTAIDGVADVSCMSGECVVHRCMPGYALSRAGTHCIPTQAHISRPHGAVLEDDEEYMQYQPF